MKTQFILFTTIFISFTTLAQKSRISLAANYGLNGNFFVRSYNEFGGPSSNSTYFYKKEFIGNIGGLDLKYNLNKNSAIELGYSRSINKSKKNYSGILNGVNVLIRDFNIRHTNNFYHLIYNGRVSKKASNLKYDIGLFYVSSQQQEISIENFSNLVNLDERNYKNSGLEEGGILTGFEYVRKIDSKFQLGVRFRVYYLVSASTLETITLTPTLTYQF